MVETSMPYSDREKLGVFFWEDFTVAEQIHPSAVSSCYSQAFERAKSNAKILIELAVVLFRKMEIFSKIASQKETFSVYASLFDEVHKTASKRLKGEDFFSYAQTLLKKPNED